MATWQTPKTDWSNNDYYNSSDINRVENNTQYIKEQLELIGYEPNISIIDTSKDNTSLIFYDDINRIESNIDELKNSSYTPYNWQQMELDWVSVYKVFDYNDANRYENNLVAMKDMVENINKAYLYCGDTMTSISGKGNTTF